MSVILKRGRGDYVLRIGKIAGNSLGQARPAPGGAAIPSGKGLLFTSKWDKNEVFTRVKFKRSTLSLGPILRVWHPGLG